MGSYNTTLCLVNLSGKAITSTAVTIDHADDWDYVANDPDRDEPWRPDLNFTGALANGEARCEREEINSETERGCWFSLGLTFDDGSTLSFRADQWDALSKQSGNYTHLLEKSPQNAGLQVYRTTGEDRYVYSNSFYIRPSSPPDNSHWMGTLLKARPAVTLNEITMPGSHDAGMYVPGTSVHANTQSLSILDQLKAGSRYFDLRVCAWNVTELELWTYHGSYYGGRLDDILNDVLKFMVASEEAVFLKFRPDNTWITDDIVDKVKSKLSGRLYTSTSTQDFAELPLSDLSGKVVAVFNPDFADSLLDPADGTFRYSDYGNEDTGQFTPPSDDKCLGVYDSYSDDNDFSVMEPNQQAKRAAYGGYGNQYLFLFSWTLTGMRALYDLELLSSFANPHLPKALRNGGNQINIVYIDQVDPWLCQNIIAMNPTTP